MKLLMALVASLALVGTAYAGGTTKEVCTPVKDKAGKEVKNKDGSVKETCKKIKVHKKVEGDKVPTK